jgi:hypothetical protein
MRKTLIALFAIVSIGMVLPTASARDGFHGGGHRGVSWGGGRGYRWHGPNWYGYGYPYRYAPYYDSGCSLVRQRFWNGYGWQSRTVQVCG